MCDSDADGSSRAAAGDPIEFQELRLGAMGISGSRADPIEFSAISPRSLDRELG